MKKFYLIVSFLSSIFVISAQNANWGTGLPVTATVNGSYVDLSVFDPVLNSTKTTSLSVGSNPIYQNKDGVVVAYGSSGYMDYATYDVQQHSWRTGSTSIGSSNGMIATADGVVVGYGSSGYMDYATYDSKQQSWRTGSTSVGSSNGIIATADGVVVGYGSSGYMDYATYDPQQQSWRTGSTSIGTSNGVVATADGVVVGYGSSGYMDYAIYDAQQQSWRAGSTSIGSSSGIVETSDGVVVGYGSSGYVDFAIYDFNQQSWKSGSQSVGSSGGFTLSAGTVTYSGSSSGIKGYNPNSHSWGSTATTPVCKFIPVVTSGSNWVFMRCMSMGASTFTYTCGDGHQISRKQGWKRYATSNQYNADLNVSNGISNSSCSATINVISDIQGATYNSFHIYPNPSNGRFYLQFKQEIDAKIEVFTLLGQLFYEKQVKNESNVEVNLDKKGFYFITVSGKGGRYTEKIWID